MIKKTNLRSRNIHISFFFGIFLVLWYCYSAAEPLAVPTTSPKTLNKPNEDIFANYYKHPQPDKLPEIINGAISSNTLSYGADIYTAFIARVAKDNPEKIETWMKKIKINNDNERTVIYRALWNSDTKKSKQYLEGLTISKNNKIANIAKQVISVPPEDVLNKKITADVLDQLWASYTASGDDSYLLKILEFLNQDDGLLTIAYEIENRRILCEVSKSVTAPKNGEGLEACKNDDIFQHMKTNYSKNYPEAVNQLGAIYAAYWSLEAQRRQDKEIDAKIQKIIDQKPKLDYRKKIGKALGS